MPAGEAAGLHQPTPRDARGLGPSSCRLSQEGQHHVGSCHTLFKKLPMAGMELGAHTGGPVCPRKAERRERGMHCRPCRALSVVAMEAKEARSAGCGTSGPGALGFGG